MNKQKVGDRRGIEWTDYTWNPIGGCLHRCRWEMPDGSIAECYAETVAEKFTGVYPEGFEYHYWHPHRLEEPLKVQQPSMIFLDSMSDIMGHWVPNHQIEAVLDIARQADRHTFQLLTKNTPRLLQFEFPANVWVGASTPPDFMWARQLNRKQRDKMLARTLEVLRAVEVPVRWMSVEPLSWDVADHFVDCGLQWVVIGAASNGPRYYQPDPGHVERLLKVLDDQKIPVFFKGNLKWSPWRENYPLPARKF